MISLSCAFWVKSLSNSSWTKWVFFVEHEVVKPHSLAIFDILELRHLSQKYKFQLHGGAIGKVSWPPQSSTVNEMIHSKIWCQSCWDISQDSWKSIPAQSTRGNVRGSLKVIRIHPVDASHHLQDYLCQISHQSGGSNIVTPTAWCWC